MKKLLFLICVVSVAAIGNSFTYADDDADKVLGVWLSSKGKAKIKIEKIGSKYYGKIVWMKEPKDKDGNRKLDKENPDKKMRNVPILGLRILKDFEYVGDSKWEKGTIYDPEGGSTYSCKMELKDDNTLKIRGYIGVSLLGRTEVWSRVGGK